MRVRILGIWVHGKPNSASDENTQEKPEPQEADEGAKAEKVIEMCELEQCDGEYENDSDFAYRKGEYNHEVDKYGN